MSNKSSSDQIIQGTMGSYLQMPYNRYLWLRLEFMAICNDEIEAKIMRIVEYDIEGARTTWLNNASALAANGKPYPPAPEQWWVTLSYKQIMTKMYGTVKNEKTIIAKLNSLVKEKKYLQKRVDPENPYGAPQYTINKEVVQGKLDKLPPLPIIPDVAKLYSEISSEPVPATGTPSNKEGEYQLLVPPVPATGTPRTSEWNSPVPATGTEGYQLLVHNKNKKNFEENKELKESIVSGSATQPFVAKATPSPSLSSQSLSSEEMKPKVPSKKKTEEPKGPPVMPPADMEWGTTKCKMMFDAWRGHTLIAQYKIMEASKCAKGLAEQFTEEEVRRVYQAMSEDAYWKERGGPDICNVANNIDKELKKMKSGKVTKQTSSHGTASHDGYTKEERLALYKMTQEERKMYNQKRREARERAMEVQ